MTRRTKAEREAEQRFDESYRKHGHGVQINIMDLGKVSRGFHAAIAEGATDDDAMTAVLTQYRKN